MSKTTIGFLAALAAIGAGVLACKLPPYEPTYDVVCPVEPVPMVFDSWSTEFELRVGFVDCKRAVLPEVIVRGERHPDEVGASDVERVYVSLDGERGDLIAYGDIVATSYGEAGGTGPWWALLDVVDESPPMFHPPSEISGGLYRVGVSGMARPELCGEVTIEFQYDCFCDEEYSGPKNETYDFAGLDVRFEPDRRVRTEPETPLRLTPFDIVWENVYDWWPSMDPPRYGSGGVAFYWITSTETGENVEWGEVRLPPLLTGGLPQEVRVTSPGLEARPEGETYLVRVKVNSLDTIAECNPPPRFVGPGFDVRDNNTGFGQFEVDWCDCSDSGDLAIEAAGLDLPPEVGHTGTAYWRNCYAALCGTASGESGEFTESIRIETEGGSLVMGPWSSRRASLPPGSCEDRSLSIAEPLPVGAYRLIVELDPEGEVVECSLAGRKNQRAELPIRILPPPVFDPDGGF